MRNILSKHTLEKTNPFKTQITDILEIKGTGNERIIQFDTADITSLPLYISFCGITYPTENYHAKRFPVRGFILEYVVGGKGYVIVNGKKHTVSTGDSYLLKIGENCEYYADKENPFQKMWVNIFGSFAHDIVELYQLNNTVYKNTDLTDLFERLYAIEKISTDLSVVHLKISAIITEMMLRLAQSNDTTQSASNIAKQVHHELIMSVNKPFRLEQVSEKLYLSKSELVRHFKKYYGTPPYQYLINLRITHAKNMLVFGDWSIAQISDSLCFADPYYFSNVFKKHVGLSPLQYRKSIRKKN